MLFFKDSADGYYQFADDAPPEWYAHLTPTAQQLAPPPPAPTPQEKRAALYPPLTDFADAYYWQEQGDPSKMAAWVAACAAVKALVPK